MTQPLFALSLGFGGLILATQIAFSAPRCDTGEARTHVPALADLHPATGFRC